MWCEEEDPFLAFLDRWYGCSAWGRGRLSACDTHGDISFHIVFFHNKRGEGMFVLKSGITQNCFLTGVQMVDFSWAPSLASLWVSVWRSLAPGDIGEWTEGMEMIFHDMICIYVYISTYTVHV